MKTLLILILTIKMALASQTSPFNGAYGGLALTNSFLIGKLSSTRDDLNVRYVKMANNKISPEVFVGWGGIWGDSPLYLGFEGYGAYHNLDLAIKRHFVPLNESADKHVKIRNTLGGVGRFGYATQDFLIALRLGMAYSNFHARYKDYENHQVSEGSNKWGKLGGAEIGYVLYPNWIASIKYDYISYNNLKLGHNAVDFTYKPVVHNVGIKLAHSF